MTYEEALIRLRSALKFGIDPSLGPIRALCEVMGRPQTRYACIQVAGTNGKSSTTRMIAALLRQQGFHVGLYTSPELVNYPERMEVDGQVVSDQAFADAIEAASAAAATADLDDITEFELLTAGALWLFARERVDFAVLECGLGGRWDATSVVDPAVSVITGIGLDHTAILGDTIEKIAAEKAAIIKPGGTAVLAADLAAEQVFLDRAAEVDVPVCHGLASFADAVADAACHLPAYQRRNIATAITAAEAALGRDITVDDAREAIRDLTIPGRFETLRDDPLLMIDAAHNPQSAAVLAAEVRSRFGEEPPVLLLGMLADKDVRGVVEELAPSFKSILVTMSSSPRSLPVDELAAIVTQVTGERPLTASDIPTALEELADRPVLATGSITVAGEVKRVWSASAHSHHLHR